MAMDTKQLTRNSTSTAKRAGMIESRQYATLSALLRPTTPTKIPAVIKIRIMVIMFLSPTPAAMIFSLSSNFNFGFCRQAISSAVRNETTIGIL